MELKKKLIVFLAEFDLQFGEITSIYEKLEERLVYLKNKEITPEIVESTGYWLHNLYCAFEDLFKIVAGFWENDVETAERFHINLLKRMQVTIEGIRPALLSQESFQSLNELRGFRHVFRHAYSYGLDDQRVINLLRSILNKKTLIMEDLRSFQEKIKTYK